MGEIATLELHCRRAGHRFPAQRIMLQYEPSSFLFFSFLLASYLFSSCRQGMIHDLCIGGWMCVCTGLKIDRHIFELLHTPGGKGEAADEYLYIPMYGFTESLNISVSAAICLQYLSQKMRASDLNWQLSEQEKWDLENEWVRKVLLKPEMLERRFWEERQ